MSPWRAETDIMTEPSGWRDGEQTVHVHVYVFPWKGALAQNVVQGLTKVSPSCLLLCDIGIGVRQRVMIMFINGFYVLRLICRVIVLPPEMTGVNEGRSDNAAL